MADRTSSIAGWASVAQRRRLARPRRHGLRRHRGHRRLDGRDRRERLRVRHVYRPSPRPELYQLDLTVENVGGSSADVVYRRAMDWDVPPTRVRRVRDDPRAAHPRLLDGDRQRVQPRKPAVATSGPRGAGTFEDIGPDDRGGVFDFALGTIAPGGAGEPHDVLRRRRDRGRRARGARRRSDADLYSLGQPNTPDGPTLGTPNTFMFGVTDGVVESGPVIATGRLVIPRAGRSRRRSAGASRSTCRTWTARPGRRTRWSRRRRPRRTGRSRSSAARARTRGGGCRERRSDQPRSRRERERLGLPRVRHSRGRRGLMGRRERADADRTSSILPTGSTVDMRLVPGAAAGATSGSQAYGFVRDVPRSRSPRREPGRRSASCTRRRTPRSRRSPMAGRPTRTSRRRSRSTGASGS